MCVEESYVYESKFESKSEFKFYFRSCGNFQWHFVRGHKQHKQGLWLNETISKETWWWNDGVDKSVNFGEIRNR